jgi:hypothetical protein
MISDDSKDKQTNAKKKWGEGGYSSEDVHQKRSKDSQGKQAYSRRDERNNRARTEKRMRTLEDKLYELEESNKKLKAELMATKGSTNKSTKGEICNTNDWTGEEANLADKITEFCKDFLFPHYKFLKDGWKTFNPENEKSFSFFVGKNMARTYLNMRIATTGMQYEDEWERIYVPTIGLKYTHMRCNLGSDIRSQYFGELDINTIFNIFFCFY